MIFVLRKCARSYFNCSASSFRKLSSNVGLIRRKDFSKCEASDVDFFESILGKNNVKTSDLDSYNIDFMRYYEGSSKCVLFPHTESQLSQVLKHCFKRSLAIVPQAGNTGLTGGSVPLFDEIIISMKRFSTSFELDSTSGILHCDSGYTLEDLDSRVAKDGFMMPLDLSARGSCLIGGNLATNAGGIRLIRFGSLHANVLGMRVAIPDENGTILKLGSGLRKDNSDLHLKNLFIGSEGQLGIITHASILLAARPLHTHTLFFAVNSFQKCRETLRLASKMLGPTLSAFEFLDLETIICVEDNSELRNVLNTKSNFYLLIETSGSSATDSKAVDDFMSNCMENGLLEDGMLASNAAEVQHLWSLREHASISLLHDGYAYKHDISLPLRHFYSLAEVVRKRLTDAAPRHFKRVLAFGHLGDGNLHLNVIAEKRDESITNLLYPFIYEWVLEHGGSFSAEHGIGQMKRDFHHRISSAKKLAINRNIKKVFDPKELLSPYKLIN